MKSAFSIKFLMLERGKRASFASILRWINPDGQFANDSGFVLNEMRPGRGQISALFSDGLAVGSISHPHTGHRRRLVSGSRTAGLSERSACRRRAGIARHDTEPMFQVSSIAPLLAFVLLLMFVKFSRRKPSTR
jgi:hypothetical protein